MTLVAGNTFGGGEVYREWNTLRSGWRVMTISSGVEVEGGGGGDGVK